MRIVTACTVSDKKVSSKLNFPSVFKCEAQSGNLELSMNYYVYIRAKMWLCSFVRSANTKTFMRGA